MSKLKKLTEKVNIKSLKFQKWVRGLKVPPAYFPLFCELCIELIKFLCDLL